MGGGKSDRPLQLCPLCGALRSTLNGQKASVKIELRMSGVAPAADISARHMTRAFIPEPSAAELAEEFLPKLVVE